MTKDNDISAEVVNFFSSLFSRDPMLSVEDQKEIVSSIPHLIQPHHNIMLRAILDYQKVKQALFSLLVDKSSGTNGFPTFFFQVYWEVVKVDVVNAVQEFFGARNLLKEINSTFLVLIAKISGSDYMDQFRPISLCNSFYKIISKVLMIKIIKVLPLIISS